MHGNVISHYYLFKQEFFVLKNNLCLEIKFCRICLFCFAINFQELYISELEDGNRSKAMNRLRVPPLAEELRVSYVTHNTMSIVVFVTLNVS